MQQQFNMSTNQSNIFWLHFYFTFFYFMTETDITNILQTYIFFLTAFIYYIHIFIILFIFKMNLSTYIYLKFEMEGYHWGVYFSLKHKITTWRRHKYIKHQNKHLKILNLAYKTKIILNIIVYHHHYKIRFILCNIMLIFYNKLSNSWNRKFIYANLYNVQNKNKKKIKNKIHIHIQYDWENLL